MADKTITQLTAATSPLAGTEVLPIVQSSTTVKVTVANLTAGRDVAAKKLQPTDNVEMASGKGISFAAAGGDTLSMYDEGTWAPVIRGSGTAGTYELNAGATYGNFTRIGRLVSVNAQIVLAGAITAGGTGDAQITGLPFAKSALQQSVGAVYLDTIDLNVNAKYVIAHFPTGNSSSTLVFGQVLDNANVIALPVSSIVAGSVILLQMTYFV